MSENQNPLFRKSLSILLAFFFLCVLGLIALSFIKPKTIESVQTRTMNYPVQKVWNSFFHPDLILKTRKDIDKYQVYDTISPRWVEYVGNKDTIEYKTIITQKNKRIHYLVVQRKYEQFNGFMISLDSIDTLHTRVTIREKSLYYNNWANIYFKILKPEVLIDFEFEKIDKTIQTLDSLNQL